ncbi:VWA domain-containing protein [Candidatus Igneacidithiobacillus taiwanensis]|uniref:nitric oxide reductase activation protein NorD n=1 Tax=Candidatus Igneacidithiobacillus taiwanensis TaxID=1945924 RepID=UPI00289C2C08|nr:VWA domain-containing protein [Candidatus Igneacidithiobacillus taiwanensis]
MPHPSNEEDTLASAWARLDTGFSEVERVFPDLWQEARALLSPQGLLDYLEAARQIGKLGRGSEPMLVFLEEWPGVAKAVGEDALHAVTDAIGRLQKSPNGRDITGLLQTLAPVAERLRSQELLASYLQIAMRLQAQTSGSIHGRQTTIPSSGLPEFFAQAPALLQQVSLEGLANWVEYGIHNYANHPDRQKDYFGLQSADSRAVLQRERHGTLLADIERRLDLYLRGLWQDDAQLIPYSTAFHQLRQPMPYFDSLGFRLPDVYEDAHNVAGIDRYRAALAHMVGHRRWSRPLIADNWSPFQRLAVECLEDCRIDTLLIREYPGLRALLLRLHPMPREDACDSQTTSCLRHRLAMLSRALLDPEHTYNNSTILKVVARFQAFLAQGLSSTEEVAALALEFVTRTRLPSDQFAQVHFTDTVVDYRDDNRHLWTFIEPDDEEESLEDSPRAQHAEEASSLPPRHYPEWDDQSQSYRPDWVSVYDQLHPSGNPDQIDRLLARHAVLAKRLQRLFDLLKPQDKERVRYQEDGSELDLDIALRAFIDYKSGAQPDPRINFRHRSHHRDITVLLLLDLSDSLNDPVAGTGQTLLELSQEAVSLLAWAIESLGDPFAIAGFHSNTRHEVRYAHIKGFGEQWDTSVKARLAGMQACWSTRMGAAMRHAGQYLGARKAEKKLLLVLTDGAPADVDVTAPQQLIADARQAVKELDQQGIYSYCISLDPQADAYVGNIFGRQFTVIDHIERLPERLPQLFLALTH